MFVQLLLSLLRNYFHNWSTKKNLIPLFTKRVLINLQKYRFKVLIVVDNVPKLHLFDRTNRFNFSWIPHYSAIYRYLAEFHTLLANNNFIQFSCIMILDVQIMFFLSPFSPKFKILFIRLPDRFSRRFSLILKFPSNPRYNFLHVRYNHVLFQCESFRRLLS